MTASNVFSHPSDGANPVLQDVQGYGDTRGVALKIAGVKGVQMPLKLLEKSGGIQTVAATGDMGVFLPPDAKGTHMSRFVIQMADWSRDKVVSLNFDHWLSDMAEQLGSTVAYLNLGFTYFIEKAAPVTGLSAPMAYECQFYSELDTTTQTYGFWLGLTMPIATLCPCSKEISKYGAHNQRALLKVKLNVDTTTDHRMLWLEDLVTALDETASCPVYPVLKRADEKYVTERQYDNPKFVEDVARDATLFLREAIGVSGFQVEVEALESIHGHNAWAFNEETFQHPAYPLGMR